MLVVPLATPVTTPSLTVATFGSSLDQVMALSGAFSGSTITGGTKSFWQNRNAQVNECPSKRAQWTDYQNQSGEPIDGAAISTSKACNSDWNLQSTLREFAFRHGNRVNAAYADGHVGFVQINYATKNAGHDLADGVQWYFPGNTAYPFGPRQGTPPYADNFGLHYE